MSERIVASRIESWRKVVKGELAQLPPDFASQASVLAAMNQTLRQEVAVAFAPSLNAYIQTQPQDTYAEKQHLASWVNKQLHDLDLAILCPKTKSRAILVVDFRVDPEHNNRFRLESRAPDGRKVRSCTSQTVPELTLTDDFARQQEHFSKLVARLHKGKSHGESEPER